MDKNNINYSIRYLEKFKINSLEDLITKEIKIIKLQKIEPRNKDDKILDLGCGTGLLMMAIQKLGYNNVFGCDIDKHQVEEAKKYNLNVVCKNCVDFLKDTEEKFDVIYFSDVLEHLEKNEQIEILRLIFSHLTDNGFLYIRTPNANSPLFPNFRYDDWTHTIVFTEESLTFLLKSAGFTEINIREEFPPIKKVIKKREKFIELVSLETGIKKDDFILSANLSAVVYKNKSEKNIVYDKTWGTKLMKGGYDYWLKKCPLIRVKERPFKKIYSFLGIISLLKIKTKIISFKEVKKYYILSIIPIKNENS